MTRKALGRGLNALLLADRAVADEGLDVDVSLIDPSPVQPRVRFDKDSLQNLSLSIRANGIVQPLLVRRNGGRFELIAGERRWRAAKAIGLERVPVVVREVADEKLLELALIENVQREDLNAIEEAQAYRNLIEQIGLSQESVAQRVGRDRSYITNYLRLLRLPEDLQQLVQEGKLSTGHARTILGVNEAGAQRRIARRIIERGMSVRDTERLVKRLSEVKEAGRQAEARSNDANTRAAESALRRKLGTHVRIVRNAKRIGGRIELGYYDEQDLDRLFSLLLGVQAQTS